MSITLRELPPEIQQEALLEASKQPAYKSRTTFQTRLIDAFDWSKSERGHHFWNDIHCGRSSLVPEDDQIIK